MILRCVLPLMAALPFASPSNAPDGRPDLNSFVNHRVTSVRELLAQVRNDRVVADRYERHFSMSRATLLTYLGGLHRASMPSSGVYTIYSVPQDGHVKMHRGVIRKGEPMFMNARNEPILVVKCGNPVVMGPKRPYASRERTFVPQEPESTREIVLDSEDAIPSDALTLLPELPTEVASTETVIAEMPTLTAVGALASSGSSLPYLGSLVAILPIVGSGSHSTPTFPVTPPPIPVTPPPVPVNPVPEPGTLIMLGLGTVAALRRRAR